MSVPVWLPQFLLRFVPKPDLVVVLSCPPEVMVQRKQELSIEELNRQHSRYLEISGILPNCIVVDSNRPLNEVCEEIGQAILYQKSKVALRSMHLTLSL
jgi:thymidylate kinase